MYSEYEGSFPLFFYSYFSSLSCIFVTFYPMVSAEQQADQTKASLAVFPVRHLDNAMKNALQWRDTSAALLTDV